MRIRIPLALSVFLMLINVSVAQKMHMNKSARNQAMPEMPKGLETDQVIYLIGDAGG